METQYNLRGGAIFRPSEKLVNDLETLGLDAEAREDILREMARTAEWLLNTDGESVEKVDTPALAGPLSRG